MILNTSTFNHCRSYILTPITTASHVNFSVNNFGIKTEGKFKSVSGDICFDTSQLEKAFFNAHIDVASISTGVHLRDKHLKEEEFFFESKFPIISFYSTLIYKTYTGYWVEGKLTIKEKSKLVSFPFIVQPSSRGYIFSSKFTVNRFDFDIGSKSIVLDNTVNIAIEVITSY